MYKVAALILVLCAMGCSTRLSPQTMEAKPAAVAPDGSLQISPQNTRITFVGTALANSHEGTFTQFAGKLRCPTTNPCDAQLFVEIKMDSVFTKIDLLTRHLKDEDFFDVVKYPTATFTSTEIKSAGDNYAITGNFQIHGVTRVATFPAKMQIQPGKIELNATFTIRQSDFKMESVKKTTDEVPVTVEIQIERPNTP